MSGPSASTPAHNNYLLSWHRLRALTRKETRQLVRDKSNLMVGLFLPLMLILLFGYGLTFDVQHAPVAIVTEDTSPTAQDVLAGFYLSPYFAPMPLVSMPDAVDLMRARKIDAIVYLRSDFSRRLARGDATIQVLVRGVDPNRGRIIEAFAQGAIGQWAAKRAAAGETKSLPAPAITLESRQWFNEANNSRFFLVPGLVVLIMTLNGALLTSLVMAREWERGTLEALFVTPVHATEIVIAKLVPYFVVGLGGLALCLLSAKFLFVVPVRGSLTLIILMSMIYLLVSLGTGLLISAAIKNQFLASQIALVVGFLPALMLSGFIFDLHSVPPFIRFVSRVLPATYYVEALQTLFLAGNVAGLLLLDGAALIAAAIILLVFARVNTRKELE
jgi:ABC-2 type transport system permease protein